MAEIVIRPLLAADLAGAVALLATLNPETPAARIGERLQTLLADHSHYQLIGAFADDTLAGLAGAWIATKIWCGRYLEIDNLVVAEDHRSAGLGSRLIGHLEAIGRERGCQVLVLDSYC
ncbi:GNAT family N-acetyltransferase, partial [bacterium]|nr:GNAT family N-acetyltransferase [bacterium]